MLKYIFSLLILFSCLVGCSDDQSTLSNNNETEETANINVSFISAFVNDSLKSVDLSKYRSDSIKAQPELINVFSEKNEIDNIVNWLNQIENRPTKISSEIKALYILQFSYKADDEPVETYKRIAYANDQMGEVFVQDITDLEFLNFDSFKDEDFSLIQEKLKDNHWIKTVPLKLINP